MSVIGADQAAAELGISYDLFLRTRKALEARGFPKPLPLISRAKRGRPPLRWSVEAIRDWIRNPTANDNAAPKGERPKVHARLG